jgi:hypothetical protein
VKTVFDTAGNPLSVVVMVDKETGETKLSFFTDENGHVLISPNGFGEKTITVVNRNTGKRVTKEVIVKEDDPLIEVEFDEIVLDENPKDGYITLADPELGDEGSGGSYKTLIITNYLYYTCKTDDDWLSASIAHDANILYVKAAKNETGEERKGKVTVSATDSKGKVLKSTVLTFTQKLPEPTVYWVSANPSSLLFDSGGGVLETAVGYNLVVEANPNDTGAERSGTITVFAGSSAEAVQNAKNGKLDPENATSTMILVKQEAKSGLRTNVESISFSTEKLYGVNESGDKISLRFHDLYFSKEDIEVTPLGVPGSFKCTATNTSEPYGSGKGTVEHSFSFTIDSPKDGHYGVAKDIVLESKGTYPNETITIAIECTDIPFDSDWTSGQMLYTWWKGNLSENTVRITRVEYNDVYVNDDGKVFTYYYGSFSAEDSPNTQSFLKIKESLF